MPGKHEQVLLCAATLLQNQIGRQQGASNARVATMTPLQKKNASRRFSYSIFILPPRPAPPPPPPSAGSSGASVASSISSLTNRHGAGGAAIVPYSDFNAVPNLPPDAGGPCHPSLISAEVGRTENEHQRFPPCTARNACLTYTIDLHTRTSDPVSPSCLPPTYLV